MTPQELITRKVSVKLACDENLVHDVIMFQFKEVKKEAPNQTSIEITGMGKFKIRWGTLLRRQKKLENFLKHYDALLVDESLQGRKRKTVEKKYSTASEELELVNEKLKSDEFQRYIAWMAEPSDTSEGDEGED